MSEKELLDKFIDEEYSDCKPVTEEQRKLIANTFGFQRYMLLNAWEDLKNEMKKIFPFSLLYKDDAL